MVRRAGLVGVAVLVREGEVQPSLEYRLRHVSKGLAVREGMRPEERERVLGTDAQLGDDHPRGLMDGGAVGPGAARVGGQVIGVLQQGDADRVREELGRCRVEVFSEEVGWW